MDRFYLGIDVGTGSARAGIFDKHGKGLGAASHPIAIERPAEDHVEHSSDDIWRACGVVLRGADDQPVSASTTGKPEWNVIVWMDHRAIPQAARINALGHRVLRYVGG